MQTSSPQPQLLDTSDLFRQELDAVLNGTRPIEFHFQPVVDLQDGVAVGYEALVRFGGNLRWTPDRWFLSASQFGKRAALESFVVQQSLLAVDTLPANTFLSINVGPDFLLSPEWDRLVQARGSLARLVVEITEQDAIHDYRLVQQKIATIRALGGTVATDDVGAGYASLRHVMEIRPDFVKLDRTFIEGCHRDPARSAMIEMLGTIAGRLDAWIIAEGIEVQAELQELIRLEIPLAQGFYLGRPAPQMAGITPDAHRDIQAFSVAGPDPAGVRRMVESCVVCDSADEGWNELADNPDLLFAVVIDSFVRPVLVVQRHPLLGIRKLESLMKVQVESRLSEVMQRALARPLASRFDPLAAINERGEFLGLLEIDRLMAETLHKKAQLLPMRPQILPVPFLLRSDARRDSRSTVIRPAGR